MEKTIIEKFATTKLWISGVGLMLAAGYLMNCVVEPAFANVRLIDWDSLNRALLILLIISGTRDISLNGIRLVGGKIRITNAKHCTEPDCKSFKKAVKRYWIPVVGWALVGGFFMNCVIWPCCLTTTEVDWDHLTTALMILLVVSGGRDVSLSGVKLLGGKMSIKTPVHKHKKAVEKKQSTDDDAMPEPSEVAPIVFT